MMIRILSLCMLISATLCGITRSDIVIEERIVSPAWEDYNCTNPSLLEIGTNAYLFAWEAGPFLKQSSPFETSIWYRIFADQRWSITHSIASSETESYKAPLLCKLPIGTIFCYFQSKSQMCVRTSNTKGKTWSKLGYLPQKIVGPQGSKPLILGKTILWACTKNEKTFIERSKNRGKSWEKIEIPDTLIHPSLFYDAKQTLYILGLKENTFYSSYSKNQGKTWAPFLPLPLKECSSQFDILPYKERTILLFYTTPTNSLNIAISHDSGLRWTDLLEIEQSKAHSPFAILDSDGYIQLTYSLSHRIKHLTINPRPLLFF